MLKSIYHQPTGKWCYALNNNTLRVTLRVGKGEVKNIQIRYDDAFHWGPNEKGEFVWICENEKQMSIKFSDELYDYWYVDLTHKRRRFKYHFVINSIDFGTIYMGVPGQLTTIPDNWSWHPNSFSYGFVEEGKVFTAPEWVKETIWYQIFPERFANGDKSNDPEGTIGWKEESDGYSKMYGGDLKGIINNIEYIKKQGFNGIYLNPIFKSPSTHKYDTSDYFKIDEQFGTNEEFQELINVAHENGIKIMIDGVFNHCGTDFFAWQDVLKNKEKSKYADWFTVYDWNNLDGKGLNGTDQVLPYECFGWSQNMPRLNWNNPEVSDYLLEVVEYWSKMGIDGWRLDVADEVSFGFWRKFKELLEIKYPDIFILGEIWYDANDFLSGDQFHSTMNYLVKMPIENYFGKNIISSEQFICDYNKAMFVYNDNVNKYLFNLLGSHDTDRYLSECGENIHRYFMSYAFLLLIEGCPSIYYGDEIAMTGRGDKYRRHPMLWDEIKDRKIYSDVFLNLIKIRKENIDSIYSDSKLDIFDGMIRLKTGSLEILFNNTEFSKLLPNENYEYAYNLEHNKLKPQSFVIYKEN